MKRVALVRRTPFRTARPHRAWSRAEEDKVTPELHEYVLSRDKMCLQARVDPGHQCRTNFGRLHAADDRRYLRLAHVKDQARLGKRAPSDARHLVAECDDANMNWSSANRHIERGYLAAIEFEPE